MKTKAPNAGIPGKKKKKLYPIEKGSKILLPLKKPTKNDKAHTKPGDATWGQQIYSWWPNTMSPEVENTLRYFQHQYHWRYNEENVPNWCKSCIIPVLHVKPWIPSGEKSIFTVVMFAICACGNNRWIWCHNVSTPRSRAVTDQLWWRHIAKSEKTVLSNNGEISDR